MARLSGRDWRMIGCAAAAGALVAFPAGLMLPGRDQPPARHGAATGLDARTARKADARSAYSPKVTSDPYVLDQQRRVVEALELECRRYGKHCAEAAQARRRIEENARDWKVGPAEAAGDPAGRNTRRGRCSVDALEEAEFCAFSKLAP